jgi:hypothetical protein
MLEPVMIPVDTEFAVTISATREMPTRNAGYPRDGMRLGSYRGASAL